MGAWIPTRILVSVTPVRSTAAAADPPGTGDVAAVPPPPLLPPDEGPALEVCVRPAPLPVPPWAGPDPPEPVLLRADGDPEPVAGVEPPAAGDPAPVDPSDGVAVPAAPLVSTVSPPSDGVIWDAGAPATARSAAEGAA